MSDKKVEKQIDDSGVKTTKENPIAFALEQGDKKNGLRRKWGAIKGFGKKYFLH